ncbi:MAG: hypothetical protein NZ572_06190 [Thermoflexus sp.]|nr:hypothetical protein [Thermoflexus sp.]
MLNGFLSYMANGWNPIMLPVPTPTPYQVFIPAVGAPATTSPGTSTTWISFLQSPWLYLALGILTGAWLVLRALERRRKTR